MTIAVPSSAPVRRSNRPLTQYVCCHLDRFVSGHMEQGEFKDTNTSVACLVSRKERTFSAYLYETELLNLVVDPEGQPLYIKISVGDRFIKGVPAKAVLERLNGILDNLGIHGFIPERVRIFKNRETGVFYLGCNGEESIAMGKRFAHNVTISPDPYELIIESSDIDMNS